MTVSICAEYGESAMFYIVGKVGGAFGVSGFSVWKKGDWIKLVLPDRKGWVGKVGWGGV